MVVRLREGLAVHFEEGQDLKRRAVAVRRPFVPWNAAVLEGDAADMHGEARGLAAAAVEIEIGQGELGHDDSTQITLRQDMRVPGLFLKNVPAGTSLVRTRRRNA